MYGGIAGYVGGKTDMLMMRIVDIIYSIPSMLYVILVMLIFGSNIWSILIGICISSWIGMARLVRAQVMSLKEQRVLPWPPMYWAPAPSEFCLNI